MAFSIPYTFSPNTTILSAEANANFSIIASSALDKTGDTMTGTLTALNIAAASGSSYDIGATGTRFRALYLSGAATVGSVSSAGAVSGTAFTASSLTMSGAITCAANVVDQAELKRFSETKTAPAISANVLTLDYSTGSVFAVALTSAITTVTFSNWPATGKAGLMTVAFTADGTVRAITWPAAVKWPGAVAPTMTGTVNKVDILSFLSFDGGTTIYGFISGQNS